MDLLDRFISSEGCVGAIPLASCGVSALGAGFASAKPVMVKQARATPARNGSSKPAASV